METASLGQYVSKALIFKGSRKKPLLAPRGVAINNGMLFVSDTGQNRVFIWHEIPDTEFREPDIILGQVQIADAGRNAGGEVTANSLQYPSGLWSDGQKLIVADAWNHRILIWNSLPTKNGQAADIVLGQPNFSSNEVNVHGISSDPTNRSMHWPYGVFSDGTRLWVADTGNRRILLYDSIPSDNFASADKVIGQPDFNTRDYQNDQPIWPYSVKVSPNKVMAVADTQFYRTLIWYDCDKAFETKADIIIGQKDFKDAGQNQFGLFPSARSLSWTYDICFYKKGLFVVDTGNSRVLYYKKIPQSNNAEADAVIGKRDFTTSSENKETLLGTESSLYWPFSITINENQLIAADTGNHRLVITNLNL